MTQATAKITDEFKRTFVVCNNITELTIAQTAMFQMGFRLKYQDFKDKSHRDVTVQTRSGKVYTHLYVNEDCEIFKMWREAYTEPFDSFKEVTLKDLTDAAVAVLKIKRRESKQSKKRRAQRKWDATAIKRTTENCPVRRDVIVTVRLKDGSTITRAAGTFDWKTDYNGGDIESYKVHTPNKVRPKPEWIDWNSGAGFNWGSCSKGWSGNLKVGTKIDVKFRSGRIETNLSAGKDTQASGAFWNTEGHENDIVAYRLSVPVAKKVTQEEMVADIADSMGKGLAVQVRGVNIPANTDLATVAAVERIMDQLSAPDTNPKKQYGVQSVPLNMWSPLASAYGALGLYNGSLKYGKANFANTPVEASIYIAAAQRHLAAWASGEEFDPADGVPNLGGVLANIAILLEARAAGMLIDDRLKMDGYLKERDALKDIVKKLTELHAGKSPKHYTLEAE